MKMFTFATAWIDDPEMGLIHGEMPTHQSEDPPQYNRFKLRSVAVGENTAGELFRVRRCVDGADKPDGPELQRFCNRGNGMGAHLIQVREESKPLREL